MVLCDGNEKSKPVTALPELPQLAQKDKSGQVAKKAKLITATLTCFGVQIAAAIKRDIYFESTYTPCLRDRWTEAARTWSSPAVLHATFYCALLTMSSASSSCLDLVWSSSADTIFTSDLVVLARADKCRGIKGGVQMDDTEDVAMEETYRVG
ncbi:hypothetical protein GN244_ATG10060 [Phytophthora infestans]|uniref:Uncharacterized protein n=1 Tax=Phytophthora infestans TaxID=4787 RepID=A0A833T5J4_PHYIN|nr:hypothetical protein GN244_ATG10060 [Phytophthora infestans]